ncbi:MAG TPA: Clp protease N-terminal domain-containing protein [bacterium]|jgi:ATP-dependent Clp protease ATP-binding subunit ClpA
MWEKFTSASKRVVKYAHEGARHFRNDCVDAEHLLLGLLQDGNSFAVKALFQMNVNIEIIRSATIQDISIGQYDYEILNFSKKAKEVLELAYKEASLLNQMTIGSEHFLLGMLRVQDCKAAEILNQNGVTYQQAKKIIIGMMSQSPSARKRSLDDSMQELKGASKMLQREKYDPEDSFYSIWEYSDLHSKELYAGSHAESLNAKSEEIDPAHILVTILSNEHFRAHEALKISGADITQMRTTASERLGTGTNEKITRTFSEASMIIFKTAEHESIQLECKYIGTEQILLGLIRDLDSCESKLLSEFGVTYHRTKQIIMEMADKNIEEDKPD